MLSVNPIEQTQSFRGIKPSLKKVASRQTKSDTANMVNTISAIFWIVTTLGVLGSAVYSIVNAFSQNSKRSDIEMAAKPRTIDSENTLDLTI